MPPFCAPYPRSRTTPRGPITRQRHGAAASAPGTTHRRRPSGSIAARRSPPSTAAAAAGSPHHQPLSDTKNRRPNSLRICLFGKPATPRLDGLRIKSSSVDSKKRVRSWTETTCPTMLWQQPQFMRFLADTIKDIQQHSGGGLCRQQSIQEQLDLGHVLMYQQIAKLAGANEFLCAGNPTRTLGIGQHIQQRFGLPSLQAGKRRQQLLSQMILQTSEARDEGIDFFRQVFPIGQPLHPILVNALGEQGACGVAQMFRFPFRQGQRDLGRLGKFGEESQTHNNTPFCLATRKIGASGVRASLISISIFRSPKRITRAPSSRHSSDTLLAKRRGVSISKSMSPPRWASSAREPNSHTRASSPTISATVCLISRRWNSVSLIVLTGCDLMRLYLPTRQGDPLPWFWTKPGPTAHPFHGDTG
ncbi:MAG: hypothetical protein OZSIB_1733 [Candidatus Ozemobacter sibiricus]|uniref:Uncharacterized protein n=1 Tax=Candidatus Ozemobacter sibiricus TaxID=2268124 RepID=A0A367ZK32_9BACT|nr:MAG: hypothetical protein OZSIB_1733 [Candidatus Ozemobacter sibiricus]